MAYKSVEDQLKDPKSLNARHNINFGSSFLKLESLIVAHSQGVTLNGFLLRGVQLAIREFKRNNKAEYDAAMKKYGGLLNKDKT